MITEDSAPLDNGSEVDELLKKKDFGASLRKAREAAGLSVNQVAEKLLISVDIIKAIDNSQAELLPAATFTQGYIRSYARILKLNADDIIKIYIQVVPETKQSLTPHSVLPANAAAHSMSLTSSVVLVLVILLVGGGFWIYNSQYTMPSLPDFNQKQNKSNEYNQINDENDGLDANQFDFEKRNRIELDQLDASDESDSQVPTTTIDSQAEEAIGSNLTAIEKSQQASQGAVAAAPVEDTVVVSALEDSWCEITDKNGNRLLYQLVKASTDITVKGQSPFKIFLGNARKVRLEVNRQIVSFDDLILSTSNIANLSVNADAKVTRSSAR